MNTFNPFQQFSRGITAGAAAAVAVLLIAAAFPALCSAGAAEELSLLESFQIETVYKDTPRRFQALYRLKTHLARLDIHRQIGGAEATARIRERLHALTSLYAHRLSPYPGELSHEIVCEEIYHPRFGTIDAGGLEIQYAEAGATERLTFGACVDDLITYRGAVAWFWCPVREALVQLELMIPKQELNPSGTLQTYLRALNCAIVPVEDSNTSSTRP